METGDRDICDPETLFSNLSRDMLNHELPAKSIPGLLLKNTKNRYKVIKFESLGSSCFNKFRLFFNKKCRMITSI